MNFRILCEACDAEAGTQAMIRRCAACGGKLTFAYDYGGARLPAGAGGMWDYADLLPLGDPANIVTLGEGATPLLAARQDRGCRLFWKNEARNPTGSQKDRALSLAVSKAKEFKVPRVIIASTGSAGLACAAYCARAGIPCLVLVPQVTPAERLLPMQALGARIVEMEGTFVQIEQFLHTLELLPTWYDATTKRAANPFQAEAPKTIAYEIVGQLGQAPDWVIVPVGGGATLFGIWRGFLDLQHLGCIARVPRLVAVQPARFNTLEVALQQGLRTQADLQTIAMDERVETIARNLKHGVPPDGADALRAVGESGGTALSVTDADALDWQRRLGTEEGIFCEPSSAVAGAAAAALVRDGIVRSTETVVAVITGSGLRELGAVGAVSRVPLPPDASPTELDRILPV